MRFRVEDKPYKVFDNELYMVVIVGSGEVIAYFNDRYVAGDYVDFLNDKYVDKEMHKEWGKVNVAKRIIYHAAELIKLSHYKHFYYNDHGNEVKVVK